MAGARSCPALQRGRLSGLQVIHELAKRLSFEHCRFPTPSACQVQGMRNSRLGRPGLQQDGAVCATIDQFRGQPGFIITSSNQRSLAHHHRWARC